MRRREMSFGAGLVMWEARMATARREADRPGSSALRSGGWRDLVTLLHPPYTAWHLSYVALGAAVAPHLYPGRLIATLAAFGLAVGISAHALDELNGRPLRTQLTRRTLITLAVVSLVAAIGIGVAGVILVCATRCSRRWCSWVAFWSPAPTWSSPAGDPHRYLVRDRVGWVSGVHRILRERADDRPRRAARERFVLSGKPRAGGG